MRILAFHFAVGDAAEPALDKLRVELDGGPTDVQTASVVVDGEEGTLLGMTVEQGSRSAVINLVTSHGGRLVADVPEEWTDRPRD